MEIALQETKHGYITFFSVHGNVTIRHEEKSGLQQENGMRFIRVRDLNTLAEIHISIKAINITSKTQKSFQVISYALCH